MNMQQLITTFQPISLDEMKGIRLMNRIDTKFITTTPMLLQLLNMASQGALALLDHALGLGVDDAHQHGHANRQKMRYRTYVDSNLQFLEVKTKNNHGRTKKKRIQAVDRTLNDEKLAFLQETLHYDAFSLRPTLENEFHRITLVNHNRTERVTLDTDLRYHHILSGQERAMNPLVIIELKRDGLCTSPILGMLRQLHIHPHGFSKYCMGAVLTDPTLPVNLFKPKLRDVERLVNSIL